HGLPRRGDRSACARGRGRRGDRPGAGPLGGRDPSPGRAEMISFRDVVRRESTEDKVEYLVSRAAAGDAEGAYVEAGELEQGVLDALHAERDGWGGVEGLLRELSRATGAAYRASR